MRLAVASLLLAWTAAGQDFSNLRVEKFGTGYVFVDGPVWSPEGYLIFGDVAGNQLLQLKPGVPMSVFREHSNGAAGNAFDSQGRLYSCEAHARRITRTDKKGKVDVVIDRYQGKRFNAPNDIVVRKDGHIYFTDPAFGNQQD